MKDWLPGQADERDAILLKVMGSPHALQISGLGGGSTLTNKVAIVSKSAQPDCDVDYLFAQVSVDTHTVDTAPNCGNMLAGVGPFAIEQGLVSPNSVQTLVRVYNVNTRSKTELVVHTPAGKVEYSGDVLIDGVLDPAAPIYLNFKQMLGCATGQVFPTGLRKQQFQGVDVSCIDAAQLMVLIDSQQLGLQGDETPAQLHADAALMARIHSIRGEAAQAMGLGDISHSVLPKPVLIGKTADWRLIHSRYFTPNLCHSAHAATGAVGVAIAALIEGTVVNQNPADITERNHISIAHPSGKIEVCVEYDAGRTGFEKISNVSLVRTVKKIFEGQVFID